MTRKDAKAFPVENDIRESGLTIREYFAIKALQGILSSRGLQQALNADNKRWVEAAVETADNLINELNK